MFCTKCGQELRDGDVFCRNCGAKIKNAKPYVAVQPDSMEKAAEPVKPAEPIRPVESPEAPKKSPVGKILLIVAAAVVVSAVLILLIMFRFGLLDRETAAKSTGDSALAEYLMEEEEAETDEEASDTQESGETAEVYEPEEESAEEEIAYEEAASAPEEEISEEEEDEESDYILEGSDSRYVTKSELADLTAEELRYARNEVYARHGRKFQDELLQEYFDSKDWYVGTIEPDDFTEDMLNEYEKANVQLISAYEKEIAE